VKLFYSKRIHVDMDFGYLIEKTQCGGIISKLTLDLLDTEMC